MNGFRLVFRVGILGLSGAMALLLILLCILGLAGISFGHSKDYTIREGASDVHCFDSWGGGPTQYGLVFGAEHDEFAEVDPTVAIPASLPELPPGEYWGGWHRSLPEDLLPVIVKRHRGLGFDWYLERHGARRFRWSLVIPFYFLLILVAPHVYLGGRWLIRRTKPAPGTCPICSYDLRAHVPGDRCPECGSPIGSAK